MREAIETRALLKLNYRKRMENENNYFATFPILLPIINWIRRALVSIDSIHKYSDKNFFCNESYENCMYLETKNMLCCLLCD